MIRLAALASRPACSNPETLAWYEQRFGPPWYAFTHKTAQFVVLESDLMKNPQGAPEAAERQLDWLKKTLTSKMPDAVRHRIVFMHHPLCLKSLDEGEGYFLLPKKRRAELADLFRQSGVKTVFSVNCRLVAFATPKSMIFGTGVSP